MTKYKDTYRVESARLPTWDYSIAWWYFVTLNTKNHQELFGRITDSVCSLNQAGIIAESNWLNIPIHFNNVELDYFIIMPNHIHGVVVIDKTVETRHASSLRHPNITLSDIIGSFKSSVSKNIHEIGIKEFRWQQGFYDRIIRNEKELFFIRKYIDQNPLRWEIEKDKPENLLDTIV